MTAALVPPAPAPSVRLRPPPPLEPPYDDQITRVAPGRGPHDVELPLDWRRHPGDQRSPGGSLPERPDTVPGRPDTVPGRPDTVPGRPDPVPGPPDPGGDTAVRAAQRLPVMVRIFLSTYVEVLNERRPLRHLAPLASDAVLRGVEQHLTGRGVGRWPAGRRPAAASRRSRVTPVPARPVAITVRRVRCCQPAPGVAEIAAVLRRADDTRAVALRLQHEGGRWLCTALEFVA